MLIAMTIHDYMLNPSFQDNEGLIRSVSTETQRFSCEVSVIVRLLPKLSHMDVGRDRPVGLATRCGLDGAGIQSR